MSQPRRAGNTPLAVGCLDEYNAIMENFQSEVVPDAINENPEEGGITSFLVDLFETILLSLILFLAINAVSARIRVDGFSMEPTLDSGEFVIVNKLAYWLGEPSHQDIVVFHFPRDPEQEYIKRIIGLPGDDIVIDGGVVTVNGEAIDEPFIKSPPAYVGTWKVPDDQLFVLGDNRNNSSDSHNWGWVPMENVVGKAVFIYWPPAEWGLVKSLTNALAGP